MSRLFDLCIYQQSQSLTFSLWTIITPVSICSHGNILSILFDGSIDSGSQISNIYRQSSQPRFNFFNFFFKFNFKSCKSLCIKFRLFSLLYSNLSQKIILETIHCKLQKSSFTMSTIFFKWKWNLWLPYLPHLQDGIVNSKMTYKDVHQHWEVKYTGQDNIKCFHKLDI